MENKTAYRLLESLRIALFVISFTWLPVLLLPYSDAKFIAVAVVFVLSSIYFIVVYLILFIRAIDVLRTFKMFSRNVENCDGNS